MASLAKSFRNFPPDGWIYRFESNSFKNVYSGRVVNAEDIEQGYVGYWEMKEETDKHRPQKPVAPLSQKISGVGPSATFISMNDSGIWVIDDQGVPVRLTDNPRPNTRNIVVPNVSNSAKKNDPLFEFYRQILQEISDNRKGNSYFATPSNPVKWKPAVAVSRSMFEFIWDVLFYDRNASDAGVANGSLTTGGTGGIDTAPTPLPENIKTFDSIYAGIGLFMIGVDDQLEDWQARLAVDNTDPIAIVDDRIVERMTDAVLQKKI